MKVTIGIPYYLHVTGDMFASFMHAILYVKHTVHFAFVGGGHIDQNREIIVDKALAEKSDRLLFIDSDIAFQPDALARILAHEHPIIGGMYNYKKLPLESVVKLPGPDGNWIDNPTNLPARPIKVARMPTGFLSLHLPTLRAKIPRPWFWYDYDPKALMGGVIGEDVHFNRLATAAGLDLWCDPTIELKHIGLYAY